MNKIALGIHVGVNCCAAELGSLPVMMPHTIHICIISLFAGLMKGPKVIYLKVFDNLVNVYQAILSELRTQLIKYCNHVTRLSALGQSVLGDLWQLIEASLSLSVNHFTCAG